MKIPGRGTEIALLNGYFAIFTAYISSLNSMEIHMLLRVKNAWTKTPIDEVTHMFTTKST